MIAYLVLALGIHHTGEQLHCAYEENAQHSGGVRDAGYFFSPQDYGDNGPGRRLSASAWSNIRIKIEYTTTSALDTTQDAFLRTQLLPAAVSWVET